MKLMKFLAMALVAMAMIGCGPENGGENNPTEKSPFRVEVNTNYIQLGVDKAYFLVYLDDALLNPADLIFFDTNNEMVTMNTLEVEIDGQMVTVPEWVPTKPETKSFWVAYNSYNNQKQPVTITAVDFALPESMEDPQPENVSFVKRTFFTQFTGADCGWCPFAKAALYEAAHDEAYADKFIVAAVYTYSKQDTKLYPEGFGNIETQFGVSGYPTVFYDMAGSFSYEKKDSNYTYVKAAIDQSQQESAKAGIAVNVAFDEGNTFAIRASVKAAEEGEYYIGAWLVEDGIEAKQANYGCNADVNFDLHNNVLRIADSGEDYIGHSLGNLKAGEIKDKVFTMTIKQGVKNAWVKENCRLVVFVTTKVGGKIRVTNVVSNSVYSEPIAFEYK